MPKELDEYGGVKNINQAIMTGETITRPIGGYFELELPLKQKRLYPDALGFQSARAAFYALLLAGEPSRIWMPKYICDSMLSPVISSGIEIVFYDITQDLGAFSQVDIEDSDWFFYVNYFGVCSVQENEILQRLDASQLILDHSQAFFSPPRNCLATIYSPRKFFGVPDGGLLFTSLAISEPEEIDIGSVKRCAHLLDRLNGSVEAGYSGFRRAEEALSDFHPKRMSQLTTQLLSHIDYDTCKERRNANFLFLHEHLQHLNRLAFSHIDGPMCYPLVIVDPTARERLLANYIFVPKYWKEVESRVASESFERTLLDNCLPIPCDQRYQPEDMLRIVDIVKGSN